MKSSTKQILLVGGAVAVAGYLLLRTTEEAVTGAAAPLFALPGAIAGIPAALAGIPAGLQTGLADLAAGVETGAAALSGGIVDVIGAAGTGLVGGAAESVIGGFEEITRQQIPLRTHEPVPEVRQIPVPSPERIAYQEEIGVPILTSEQYEAIKYPAPVQAAPSPPLSEYFKVFEQPAWLQPVEQPVEQPVSSAWQAGRVVGERITGGVAYDIVATGIGREVERVLA